MVGWIILFFIVSPLIILYGAGYRYNFERKEITQTGVIEIEVEPNDATIKINGIYTKKKRLPNRAPGQYHISLEKEGYKTWKKDIIVKSKETTYIHKINLFKDTLPFKTLATTTENVISLSSSPDGKFIFLLEKINKNYQIHNYNTQKEELTTITKTENNQLPQITWSPFGSIAKITTQNNDKTTITIINPNNNQQKIYTSSQENVVTQWKPLSAETLFISDGEYINKVSIDNQETLFITPSSSVWYIDHRDTLWVINKEKTLLQSSNQDELSLTEINPQITKIVSINGERTILQTRDGIIVTKREKNILTNPNLITATDIQYNPWTQEWTVWSNHEIWNITEKGEIFLLDRSSDTIKNVKPLDKRGLLLIQKNQTITGFNPGYFVSHNLFTAKNIENLSVNVDKNTINFLGTIGEKRDLFTLEY